VNCIRITCDSRFFIFAFTVIALEEGCVKRRVRILRSHYTETDADIENLQHSRSIPTQFRYGAKKNIYIYIYLLFRKFQACETFFQAILSSYEEIRYRQTQQGFIILIYTLGQHVSTFT
jgi:hypothetical protein